MNEIELYILEKIKKDWVIRTIKENLLEKKEQSKIKLDLIRCLKLKMMILEICTIIMKEKE